MPDQKVPDFHYRHVFICLTAVVGLTDSELLSEILYSSSHPPDVLSL